MILVAVLAVLAALLVGAWLSWTAGRLDRLHRRIDSARGTLETQLLRRSGAALELAATDALDPASRVLLLEAAHRARTADHREQPVAESQLSATLRGVLADAAQVDAWRADEDLASLVDELAERCAKVELARRFHNDAVGSARPLRSRRRVRWLRLAGHAPDPRTVDLDDVPPPALQASART